VGNDKADEVKTVKYNNSLKLIPRSLIAVNKPIITSEQPEKSPNELNEVYPFNIQFLCKDVFDLTLNSNGKYDTILCLSVVKWIHLNQGDEGLIRFFKLLYLNVKNDGRVILEFQPWKSYLNNKSASDHIKNIFSTIKIRPENFEELLLEHIGFDIEKKLGPSVAESKGLLFCYFIVLYNYNYYNLILSYYLFNLFTHS
jgi:hypothetical protein